MMALQDSLDFTKPLTLSERCDEFMRDNPHVIGLIEEMIRFKLARGSTRVSIAGAVEDLRENKEFVTVRGHSNFKFNNDFRRPYGLAIVARNPQWKNVIPLKGGTK
jgi:hypothetical protein